MKCPKCGYNSFEYNNSCKKCSTDLQSYKESLGIKAIVLPAEVRTMMAASLMAEDKNQPSREEVAHTETDMFSFDLPEEVSAAEPESANLNPFSFVDEPDKPVVKEQPAPSLGEFSFDDEEKTPQAKAEESAFASLLESTSLESDKSVPASPTSSTSAASNSSPGEFDLENFSWDDTPSPVPSESDTKADDDFNSLFGDLEDSNKK